jgi:hypothetical protein
MFLALAVAASIAAQSEKQPDQWLCGGSVSTAAGSSVTVHFYVEADGNIISHYTAWDPPVSARQIYVRRRSRDIPGLSISFERADGEGIGLPTGVDVSVASERSLRWLDDSTVTMAVPGGPSQTSQFLVTANHPPYRSATLAENGDTDLLSAVDKASVISTELRDHKNKLIGSVSYDLSARAERDRLYRQAWTDAQEALRDRAKCQKLQPAGQSDLSIPIPSIPIP